MQRSTLTIALSALAITFLLAGAGCRGKSQGSTNAGVNTGTPTSTATSTKAEEPADERARTQAAANLEARLNVVNMNYNELKTNVQSKLSSLSQAVQLQINSTRNSMEIAKVKAEAGVEGLKNASSNWVQANAEAEASLKAWEDAYAKAKVKLEAWIK